MKIKSVQALEILDSRGNPTIKTVIYLEDGSTGHAAVPSGASTGKYEAVELRDNDPTRYNGKGVRKAIQNIHEIIAPAIVGKEAEDQAGLDQGMIELDGTENKSKLGANAILSVSLSIACAQAKSEKKQLYEYMTKFNTNFDGSYIMPIPEMNVLNGGRHADWATDIQEYMLFPIGARSFNDAIQMNAEIYAELKLLLQKKRYKTLVGDEGGFAPPVTNNEEPFELLSDATRKAGYVLGQEIAFGIDAAASEFYEKGLYTLKKEARRLSSEELGTFFSGLAAKYPIISFEDVYAEDDWDGFKRFAKTHRERMQIVGDDLYVTNSKTLQMGIDHHATNAILIKLNQVGTLTETINAILLAQKYNMATIISHRSGETEDTFIADLAVAMGCGQIKSGAPCRGERIAKYNRLLEIESELYGKSTYAHFPFQ